MIDFIPPGDHRGREINELQLHRELAEAGVPLAGVGLIKDEDARTVMVRVHMPKEPDAAAQQRISRVLEAHVPEDLEARKAPGRLKALREKRRAGEALTPSEQQDLLDLLLGV